ncbi:hypothetical protein [Quadrisphaera sp. DSM 44207]|uniref:hypothetical protein n=1 Tax=Quadrisphaera sp. DSM 44207 TaxID=1881057 RepID=UPI00088F6A2E|nr:hypothetical protein [Quadrisphaera sp. DSM 44207]SDQ86284.1 hypothetical protein SAMN05428996_2936 [Quadrisphaera sp. DSM 44207]
MLVTNHVLSGAVLAAAGPLGRRPAAAFVAGAVSHLLLDAAPHWGDEREHVFLRVAVVDGLAGLAALAAGTALAPRPRRLAVLAGMAGAAAPDLDKPSQLFFGASPYPARFDAFHKRLQRESPRRWPQELLVAAGLAALAVRLLRR